MRFLVTRYSALDNEPPIAGAFRGAYVVTLIRTLNSFEEFDAKFGESEGPFTSKGTNHRLHPKGIARDFDVEGWQLELASFEELKAIVATNGPVLIDVDAYGNMTLVIDPDPF